MHYSKKCTIHSRTGMTFCSQVTSPTVTDDSRWAWVSEQSRPGRATAKPHINLIYLCCSSAPDPATHSLTDEHTHTQKQNISKIKTQPRAETDTNTHTNTFLKHSQTHVNRCCTHAYRVRPHISTKVPSTEQFYAVDEMCKIILKLTKVNHTKPTKPEVR